MKNMKYFPFERNKYFYGKLLTVDDFETEQRYMNDKRRVVNRFLYGSGVVCGMNVVMVDDQTISVEPGMALDFSGREIVIDTPVVRKLSMFEGFDSFMGKENHKPYLYLCLDYEEREKEQVHNVTGSSHVEYNRYEEGGRLWVTDREPSADQINGAGLWEKTETVYEGNGIRICQTVPVWAESGQDCEIRVTVENVGQPQPIRFSYDLELTCLEYNKNNFLRVSFDESQYEKAHRYEMVYRASAIMIRDAEGMTDLNRGSFELYAGGQKLEARAECKMTVHITGSMVQDEIRRNYYRSAMEDIMKRNYQQSIILARIFVLRAGESYLIDSVEQMPFRQYVYNNVLSDVMDRLTVKECRKVMAADRGMKNEEAGRQAEKAATEVACGHVIMDLGIGGNTGQRFFSEEISHDLGLGQVAIHLGQCYGTAEENPVVYGSPEVFEEEVPFRAELAAKTDPSRGTFRIGLRLVEPTMTRYVRVNWTAVRDARESRHDMEEMAIFIKPEMLYLKTRESYYLEAKFRGVNPTDVRWTVREENGGTIEANGKYTAPNVPGIYEVMAASTVYENLRASIYIVVRDI